MNVAPKLNLLDIDSLIQDFLVRYSKGLSTLHRINNHDSDELSLFAFISELTDELRTGCVTFINNHDNLEGLDPYLFYIANSFAKQNATRQPKKSTEYLCPGCLFLCKSNLIILQGNLFRCDECKASYEQSIDPSKRAFFKTFRVHNKKGYKCPDCNRFIPYPIYAISDTISCPYLDCCFVGEIATLKRMNHPSSQTNPERLYADISIVQPTENSQFDKDDSLSKLEEQEVFHNKIELLNDIIDSQSGNLPYSSTDFTLMHKVTTYQAFKNILSKYPSEMIDYMLHKSRSGGFQNKIFQEYIRLLEESFPFCYKKGGKVYRVDSLLDPNLNIFDGISVFEASITDKLVVKNNTKEFYIGGRKAAYSQPFYIGKLLSIINKETKEPLMKYVKDYGFSRIHMMDMAPGTEVIVTHLRVPPHYQMGGMVYINRIRKKIVDKALAALSKTND